MKLAETTDVSEAAFRNRFGEVEKNSFLAQRLRTLAGAQQFGGKDKLAIATLERCHELGPSGGYDNLIRVIEES